MAQRREDQMPPATKEQRSLRPRPKGDSKEKQKIFFPGASLEGAASHSASGEIGIIESIQLENFMCHAMLGPVKLGPNVNFIVGYRGKSALLMALYLGLGGKYVGPSLGEFVKDGEVSATISIILRNRGHNAFKSEVYGASIIIQQSISISGSASYKLKDQAGNLISSKKVELMAIVDHFNIQVDNPACILPQEMGRQLLETKSDAERYKFLLKATQLEQRQKEYSEILERKTHCQDEIDQVKKQLEEFRCKDIAIEEHIQKMVALRQKLEDLKHEMAWALVSETERDLSDMISKINIGDQHTVVLNQKLEASKAKFNESEKKYRGILEKIQKLKEEAAKLGPKCIEAKEDVKTTDRAHSKAEAFYKLSQNELNELEKVAVQIHNKIEDLKKSLELAELEKQEKINMLKEKSKNFKDQEDSLVQDIEHLHQAIQKYDEEQSQIRKEESYMQQILDYKQQQLNQLKEYKFDPLKRFGSQIPALLEAIEDAYRQGQFTFKPIGPLGACIRLRDPEFALAIESCLKDLLLVFFCDNNKDEQVLQELMKRFYPLGFLQPQIIVSSFECELYDVTDKAAYHPEFPTVLTALEIDSPVVANTLIDMKSIESVLLIKSNSLACTVMQSQEPPKNCSKVLTACGDEVFENHYYSCGESRPTYLGDVEIEISHLEKEIESKMAQLLVFQQHESSLEKDVKKNQEIVNSHNQHLKEIKIRVLNITSEIRDLEDEDKSQSIGISVLEEEAQEIKEEMKEIEEKMKVQKKERDCLRQLKMDTEQRHKEFKLKCNQVSEFIESLTEEQNQTALEMNTQRKSVLYYEKWLEQHLNPLQVKKEELAMKKRELEKETTMAKYVCSERKEVTKSTTFIDGEMIVLKKTIQTEECTHGTQEEIRKQHEEVKESCLALDGKVKNLKKRIKKLDKMFKKRSATYQNYKKSLSLQCKLYFHNLLSQWSFCGEIQLDHKKETLSIAVQHREGSSTDFSDIQAFSGDVHYFSNFLFILTLWHITESPFRCLDAFDVYIDRHHRKIAMNMILRIADFEQHRQFILLTPQYMSSLPPSPLIEILEIPDPEEDKMTLPFQALNPEEEDKKKCSLATASETAEGPASFTAAKAAKEPESKVVVKVLGTVRWFYQLK
ncbi:structural maintenance of chromosomes protein 6-like [Dromiciops gliroides]|uniref:structural maintenance of chromosomes protein 6-like n=1 Tax=Dromiciops gliroides TaxID=33562 RepID=UPI001CC672B4|nr:structural maintenance of chromosomes protein 6-like [Dromiciops gliroides]